jgi:hypothetical protein
MKARLLVFVMLIALAACASHAPRCRDRLTPINNHLPTKGAHS